MASRSIDLHDLTVNEAIAEFVRVYNSLVEAGYRGRIDVIHGYGSSGVGGVIRQKLRGFLTAHADRFEQITQGEHLGNPGVTYVYPKGRVPGSSSGAESGVARAILAFCAVPKAESKILIKLVGRFGDPAIRAAIHELIKSGALEVLRTGTETKYVAT